MPLPTINIPRDTVTLSDGSTVEVRGLTRAEAIAIGDVAESGAAAIEAWLVAYGTNTPHADAEAWYDTTPSGDVGLVVDKVQELSKLRPDDPKA